MPMMTARFFVATVFACLVSLPSSTVWAAPTDFVGMNAHQPQNDVLDAAKSLGVSWVRIDFNWFQAEPKQGQYSWALFDTIIAAAKARGLKVFPTIGYGPSWASEADADGKANNEAPKVGEYQKFCQVAAARYAGQIDHWGLWNEPNLDDFFEGTMQQWVDRVVVEGVKGIKAGCPSCKVVGPELATIGSDHATYFDAALKALKQAGLMFDVITWHIYSGFVEMDAQLLLCTGDTFQNDLDSHRVCKLGGLTIYEGPLSGYEVLVKHGLTTLPVWISETGYKAPATDSKKLAEQTTYYRRVLEEQLKRSWYTHTFFYEIVDDNAISDKWGVAVRSSSGTPAFPGSYQLKPVWTLLQKVLKNQPAFGGTGTDCTDGLDNDGDKLIDYPQDTGCASAQDPSETPGTAKPDAGQPGKDAGQADVAGPGKDLGSKDSKTTVDAMPWKKDGSPSKKDLVGGADRGRADRSGAGPDQSVSGGTTTESGCQAAGGGLAAAGPCAVLFLWGVLLARVMGRIRWWGRGGRRRE